MDKLLGEHKGEKKQHSLFWHDPEIPSSVVPSRLHVLTAKQLLSYFDILILSMPGRRMMFAGFISTLEECLLYNLKMEGVVLSGFIMRVVINFFIDFWFL